MVQHDNDSSEVETQEELRNALCAAELCPDPDDFACYVPICNQRSIITERQVALYIQSLRHRTHSVADYTELIRGRALSLFAILLYIRRADRICELLDEGISDDDLPFGKTSASNRVGDQHFHLTRRDGAVMDCMKTWSSRDLKLFGKEQFVMLAPIFDRSEQTGKLPKGTILPYLPQGQESRPVESNRGGYSEVFRHRIHPSHHNFWEQNSVQSRRGWIAIKRLNSGDVEEFHKEVDILLKLGIKRDRHLIQLLGTFTLDSQPHLIFPWANANLRQYWELFPNPQFDRNMVLWSIMQMKGIANALALIHNFNTQPTLTLSSKIDSRNPNLVLGVMDREKTYGRHGDIKPENFLWFADRVDGPLPPSSADSRLVLSDFGLGRFHGRDSRSNIRPTLAQATPTYEPPECSLRIAVSRKYDTWSLGCVLLEYITWLLMGNKATDDFAEARSKVNALEIDDDKYYAIVQHTNGQRAIVASGVERWVEKLRRNRHCSQIIHDILDIIMDDMLIIEQSKRIDSRMLTARFREIIEKASQDDTYVLESLPTTVLAHGRHKDTSSSRPSNTWPVNRS